MISNNVTSVNPLLFNITLKIHKDLSEDWLQFMKEKCLPSCTDGKVIVSTQINRLLVPPEDDDLTYAVQFIFATKSIYDEKGLMSLGKFLELLDSRFRGKYVYFTTKLEVLHSHVVTSDN